MRLRFNVRMEDPQDPMRAHLVLIYCDWVKDAASVAMEEMGHAKKVSTLVNLS